jgi:hypothetical protein
MPFNFNATGIDPDSKGTNKVVPKRWYDFAIVEFVSKAGDVYPKDGTTKNGDPNVSILCEVFNDGEYAGERVFHTVNFLPAKLPDGKPTPGAGMSIHFLKTIGEPWEGNFSVDSSKWVGRKFKGYVIAEEYKGKTKNKISEIKPIDEIPF